MRRLILSAAVGAAVAALAFAPAAMAAKRTLKVQTSQTAGDFTFKFLTTKWAPKVEAMTGGAIKLELLPTKAVVPHRETIDAVRSGILDGDLTATAYFSGRDAVFALMGDLIAGYDNADQVQMFCMNGGGKEVLQKAYDKYGAGKIHVIGCGPYTQEALVVKKPIRGVADLKGVKIRAPEGLAAEVFRRAGATSVAIPFSEVYTALEKGIVDAADASAYANNASRGFHKIAQYPLFPGIHSMAILQFTINKDVWKKLTPGQQAILETWYIAAYTDLRRESDLLDRKLVAQDKAGKGTVKEVIDWSAEERAKFRQIAVKAWEDFSKKSPLAKEAFDAHVKFMKLYGLLK